MNSRRVGILVAAAAFFVIASPVMALIEFNDGGAWDIDYKINDAVRVDYESPEVGTTVNIVEGARIYTFLTGLTGYEDSAINVRGGSIDNLNARGGSQVTVSGGSITFLNAGGGSQVTVSGGSIDMLLQAYESSQVTVSGGVIKWELHAYDSGQVTVSDGSMMLLKAHDNSEVAVSGGMIRGRLEAWESSHVTVSGGLLGKLRLSDNAVVTIDGSDFAVDGTDVGYVELTSVLGLGWSHEPNRRLTGTLLSGEPLDSYFDIGNNAKIVLVPEPGTVLLVGLGGLFLRRSRKR